MAPSQDLIARVRAQAAEPAKHQLIKLCKAQKKWSAEQRACFLDAVEDSNARRLLRIAQRVQPQNRDLAARIGLFALHLA